MGDEDNNDSGQRREFFAHSLPGEPKARWESLPAHLHAVARMASDFAAVFGWAAAAHIAGLLHDIGKCSAAFQAYIAQERANEERSRGPDHSTAGARVAMAQFGPMGPILAYAIAGHHAGLADRIDLDRRLDAAQTTLEPYEGWATQTGPLLGLAACRPTRQPKGPCRHRGFREGFLTRMLFSCLVDADFLATEAFYLDAEGRRSERGGHASVAQLNERLRAHLADKAASSVDTPLNRLRQDVLAHATAKAACEPGLFTLTVPTGGGKTLTSLSFALEHAERHGLQRVVYVIPFSSIVEQTADVFRTALGTDRDVLEHHASFDWEAFEKKASPAEADQEGPGGVAKLRRAAENWDVPVVVTTAVQFFESLFAARTSRCRKLHNLAGAVIVLDEVQTLPLRLLRPCMAALEELALSCGASVVLCTATQPALRAMDGFNGGFDIGEDRELAPDPKALYTQLKRVHVTHRPGTTSDAEIVARFAEQGQMLCVVNSRTHAQQLFAAIAHMEGAAHLTTLMCPKHRRRVLSELREKLKVGEPVRLVSTSLIEAGVDISFPEAWRAEAGLDSVIQTAGRVNREGRDAMGQVVVFTPAEHKTQRDIAAFWQATQVVLSQGHLDLVGLEAVQAYFSELYWQKGAHGGPKGGRDPLDDVEVGDLPGVLPALAERARDWAFPFAKIAQGFKVIDEAMPTIVVPWDGEAEDILARMAGMERPMGSDLRRLQQYTVSIPKPLHDSWLGKGVLLPVNPHMGDELLKLGDKAHYRADAGLDIGDPSYRESASNVF